ncbi:MAG: metalloregulator ArsR/SmtB family transcription factor [Gemmatimonadota bacterium]
MTTIPNLLFERLSALADPIRCRLLLALERQELTVSELKGALQLPQSTVSRHLKVLGDEGWVSSRSSGTSNWYRFQSRDLDPAARRLWLVVREQVADTAPARRDADRIRTALADRHSRSQEFFATRAAQWDRLRAELFGSGIEWAALAGFIEPEWTVADLGAGTGQLTAALAPLVRRVIAVDESAAMLRSAGQRLKGWDSVELKQGSLESLPIETGSLDAAFAVLVLHHISEPAGAIEESARALRAGGRLIVVDMVPHERSEYRETMGHQWLGFSAEELGRWSRDAGLTLRTYRPLPPGPAAKGPGLFVAALTK